MFCNGPFSGGGTYSSMGLIRGSHFKGGGVIQGFVVIPFKKFPTRGTKREDMLAIVVHILCNMLEQDLISSLANLDSADMVKQIE